MSKKHVELLMEAVALKDTQNYYLCNRIGYITGYYYTDPERNLRNAKYNEDDFHKLESIIQKNIEDNIVLYEDDGDVNTFGNTTFAEQGMTRKEWAETILAPLALELEEN